MTVVVFGNRCILCSENFMSTDSACSICGVCITKVNAPPKEDLKLFKITICKRSNGLGEQYESILILSTDPESAEGEAWKRLGYHPTEWKDNTWTTEELTGPFNSGSILAIWEGK